MNRLRKGDNVIVISGSNKGSRGEIDKVIYTNNKITHVLITGINMHTKHMRPNPNKGEPGGKVKREAPVHVSNVALYNEDKQKPDRVRIVVDDDGARYRVYASTGARVN